METTNQKITPFLWFDKNAEEAVNFYISVFKDAKIKTVQRVNGAVLTIAFELNGQEFVALNGGPMFKFNEAVSFVIYCKDQDEIDYFWKALSEGGQEQQCGWLKDKFGLSWQVVPVNIDKLLNSGDPQKTDRAMQVLMKMVKLDIKALQEA